MKLTLVKSLGLGLTALTLTSCGQLGALGDALKPYTPKLRFESLALQGLDFTKIDVDFVFAIDNPNPLAVKLDTFSYDLGLEGVSVVKGHSDDGIALASQGSSEFKLPVSLKYEDIFALVGNVKGKDSLAFSFSGDFGFNTPVGVAKIPFEETGDFPVVHAPDVSLKGLRMGKLDIFSQTATLNLDLGFKNEGGGAPIAFSGLDYKVSLGSASVAAGLVDDIPQVAAGAEQTVTIPLNLNLRSLGGAVVSAVTSKSPVEVDFDGTVKVGTPFGVIPLDIAQLANLDIL